MENCKTESINSFVIAVYKVILEHENSDSDYWNEDHGSQDLIQIFENCFNLGDWKDLELDLKNWTNFQLELFTQAILGGYLSYTNEGVYNSEKEIVKELTKTVPNRFDLLFPIIELEKERKLNSKDLSHIIIDYLDFINDHFDILIETDSNYIKKIKSIFLLLGLTESNSENVLILKQKIQNASI
nr:hypothetical protein [Flavobacterium sp. MC2016-06]MBU3858503.1 hypothetical protein [Flavobacterium sp. MC2016-06]